RQLIDMIKKYMISMALYSSEENECSDNIMAMLSHLLLFIDIWNVVILPSNMNERKYDDDDNGDVYSFGMDKNIDLLSQNDKSKRRGVGFGGRMGVFRNDSSSKSESEKGSSKGYKDPLFD